MQIPVNSFINIILFISNLNNPMVTILNFSKESLLATFELLVFQLIITNKHPGKKYTQQ